MGAGLPIVVSWLKVYTRKIDIIIVIIQFIADIVDGGEPFRRLNMLEFIKAATKCWRLVYGGTSVFPSTPSNINTNNI